MCMGIGAGGSDEVPTCLPRSKCNMLRGVSASPFRLVYTGQETGEKDEGSFASCTASRSCVIYSRYDRYSSMHDTNSIDSTSLDCERK